MSETITKAARAYVLALKSGTRKQENDTLTALQLAVEADHAPLHLTGEVRDYTSAGYQKKACAGCLGTGVTGLERCSMCEGKGFVYG